MFAELNILLPDYVDMQEEDENNNNVGEMDHVRDNSVPRRSMCRHSSPG